MGKTWR